MHDPNAPNATKERSGPMMPTSLKLLTPVLCLGALACALALPKTGGPDSANAFVALCLLAAFAGSMAVRVPRMRIQVTPGDAFVFASLIVVGPFAAPLIALLCTAGALVGPERRPLTLRTAFNFGALTLSAAAAARAQLGLGGMLGDGPSTAVVALVLSASTYFLVNSVLVAAAITLERREDFFETWTQIGLSTVSATATSLVLALGLAFLFDAVGPLGLVLGLSGAATIAGSIRALRRHAAGPGDGSAAVADPSPEAAGGRRAA